MSTVSEPATAFASQSESPGRPAGLWRTAWRRFRKSPLALFGCGVLVLVVAATFFSTWLAPHDPLAVDPRNRYDGPSGSHWLGTDALGRDVVSRLIDGTALSMRIAGLSVLMSVVIGLVIGLLAGYTRPAVDTVVMRVIDAMMSVPALILALALAGVVGGGSVAVIVALVVVFIPTFVRYVRGQTLAIKEETFVEASRSIGSTSPWIVKHRVFPNLFSGLTVVATIILGRALIAEASLSFLGVGVDPPRASLGGVLRVAYEDILIEPANVIYPALAIGLIVFSFSVVGDRLGESLGRERPQASRVDRSGPSDRRGLTTVARTEMPAGSASSPDAVLEIVDLSVGFATDTGFVKVVDGVSLTVRRGEVLGLVGESGSGKTVTSLAVPRLLPSPPARITGGSIGVAGQDVLSMSLKELRQVRGAKVGFVFQDPNASLDPSQTVGRQVTETLRIHQGLSVRSAEARARQLLEDVGVPDPARRLHQYPHEFSGGMRQRVMIAAALAGEPDLLIADEPTTALDVTIEAQIIQLLKQLAVDRGLSVLFITHDLGLVAGLCDRVSVMYAGRVVESASVEELFAAPRHPYTRALIGATTHAAVDESAPVPAMGGRRLLTTIPGSVPSPGGWPHGCRFSPRCAHAIEACTVAEPSLVPLVEDHATACLRSAELYATPAVAIGDGEHV